MEIGDFFLFLHEDEEDTYSGNLKNKPTVHPARFRLNCGHRGHSLISFRRSGEKEPYGTLADLTFEADRPWKCYRDKRSTRCVFCVSNALHTRSMHDYVCLSFPLGQVKITQPYDGIICVLANFQKCANLMRGDDTIIRASVRDETTILFDGLVEGENCPLCLEQKYHTILSHHLLLGIKPATMHCSQEQ